MALFKKKINLLVHNPFVSSEEVISWIITQHFLSEKVVIFFCKNNVLLEKNSLPTKIIIPYIKNEAVEYVINQGGYIIVDDPILFQSSKLEDLLKKDKVSFLFISSLQIPSWITSLEPNILKLDLSKMLILPIIEHNLIEVHDIPIKEKEKEKEKEIRNNLKEEGHYFEPAEKSRKEKLMETISQHSESYQLIVGRKEIKFDFEKEKEKEKIIITDNLEFEKKPYEVIHFYHIGDINKYYNILNRCYKWEQIKNIKPQITKFYIYFYVNKYDENEIYLYDQLAKGLNDQREFYEKVRNDAEYFSLI